MPALIDTHCHLTFDAFDEDREAVLERARAAGVDRCVAVAVDEPTARACLALATATGGYVVPTAGIHPNEAGAADPEAFGPIADLIHSGAFVAVGETGLDTYWDQVALEHQLASLVRHVELALETDLPVVLHCRDAFAEMAEVLGRYRGSGLRGVLHCFTGAPADVEPLLEAGLHVGVGGIATFKKSESLRAAIAEVPDERLLVETDAPFLAPMPVRGKRNEPGFVAHISAALAGWRGRGPEEMGALTTRNAEALFRLAPREAAAG